ncbi:MAG TPA: potassium transporter, partial [Burkholderiaceae bacterium]|nr:potassium transporter [Burkholderiaceae bacterium]
GSDDDSVHDLDQTRLSTLILNSKDFAVGRRFSDLQDDIAVQLLTVRRSSGELLDLVSDQSILQTGDTLVLSGKPEALALIELKLVEG